jgi:hypothetical protein
MAGNRKIKNQAASPSPDQPQIGNAVKVFASCLKFGACVHALIPV